MTRAEFCEQMQDVLQTDAELTAETDLNDLDEWDSLAKMATMAFFDRSLGIQIGLRDFNEVSTLGDLMVKAGL